MSRAAMGLEPLERRQLMAAITVANNNDSGAGSLRAAIESAQPGDAVYLTHLTGTITLQSQIEISKDIAIHGPGAGTLSLSGNGTVRPLSLTDGIVTIDGLNITSGYHAQQGGAIRIASGSSLTLARVSVTDSVSATGGGIFIEGGAGLTMLDSAVTGNSASANGAGIFSSVNSVINLNRCTISGNSVFAAEQFSFAGMGEGGGLELLGVSSTLVNCTIANNTVTAEDYSGSHLMDPGMEDGYARGAGIHMGNGTVSITNSTIAGNHANATTVQGGGVSWLGNGSLTIRNTIIADNVGTTTPDVFLPASFTSAYNLIGKFAGTGATHGVDGNQFGTPGTPLDAKLLALTADEGFGQTMALDAQSPAINAGHTATAPAQDQRRLLRSGTADIGAYEVGGTPAAIATFSAPPARAAVNVPFTQTISLGGPSALPVSVVIHRKPAWLRFTDHGDGSATLSGLPPIRSAEANYVEIYTDDGNSLARRSLHIVVSLPRWSVNDSGVLLVQGTATADDLTVNRSGDRIRVIHNGEHKLFDAASITAIQVLAHGGNDRVSVEGGDLPIYVLGDEGNDTLIGGSGAETLTGGAGKDVIYGNGGHDTIYGSAGNDKLFGGEGSDRLNGDDANDLLDGGSGRDRMYGGAGDDILHARDRRADYVDGGAGFDTGHFDNRFATEDWRDLEQFTFID